MFRASSRTRLSRTWATAVPRAFNPRPRREPRSGHWADARASVRPSTNVLTIRQLPDMSRAAASKGAVHPIRGKINPTFFGCSQLRSPFLGVSSNRYPTTGGQRGPLDSGNPSTGGRLAARGDREPFSGSPSPRHVSNVPRWRYLARREIESGKSRHVGNVPRDYYALFRKALAIGRICSIV